MVRRLHFVKGIQRVEGWFFFLYFFSFSFSSSLPFLSEAVESAYLCNGMSTYICVMGCRPTFLLSLLSPGFVNASERERE